MDWHPLAAIFALSRFAPEDCSLSITRLVFHSTLKIITSVYSVNDKPFLPPCLFMVALASLTFH
jgi:hypothetical protein